MTDLEFVIALTAMGLGTFLITVRMIIGAIKWRVKQKKVQTQGESLALAELEDIVRQASLEANRPLVEQVRQLEKQLRLLQEQDVSPGIRTLSIDEDTEPAEKTVGRRVRER